MECIIAKAATTATNLFKCDGCNFDTRGKLSLVCHKENTHLGIFRCSCSACAFQHYDGQHVKEHQERDHEGRRELNPCDVMFPCSWCPFQPKTCKLCSGEFSSRKYLRSYFQPSHQDWLVFACDDCDYGNVWIANDVKFQVLRHRKSNRSKIPPF